MRTTLALLLSATIKILLLRAGNDFERCPVDANASFGDYNLLHDYVRNGSVKRTFDSSITIGFLGSYGRSQVRKWPTIEIVNILGEKGINLVTFR